MPARAGILTALPGETRTLLRSAGRTAFSASELRETLLSGARLEILLLCPGPGPDRARTAVRRFAQQGVERIFVTGVCGALAREALPGDLVVGRGLRTASAGREALPLESRGLITVLREAGLDCLEGTVYGAEAAVRSAGAKARLRGRTGALVVDTESGAAAAEALRSGITCSVLRAVSDGALDGLPFDPDGILRPDGSVRPGALLRHLLGRPSSLPAFFRLGRSYGSALASLRRAWTALLGPDALERVLAVDGGG